jgi:transposase
MDGVLLQSLMEWDSGQLVDLVARLRAEVGRLRAETDQLRAEVGRLQRENYELRQQAGFWKSCFQRQEGRLAEAKAENEQLQAEIRRLKAQVFGRKSEKQGKDRSNHVDASQDDTREKRPSNGKRGQQPGRPAPQRRDHSHLPAEEEFIPLPESERACPHCGKPRKPMTLTEDSEVLEIEVKAYRRVYRRQRCQATCDCGPRTITAPPPPKLIPKGGLGLSIWLDILLAKYDNHQPISRVLAEWRLRDLDIPSGTVLDGLQRFPALFAGLYEALCQRNAAAPYTQADETRWMVFIRHEGKVGYLWWLWAFLSQDTVVFRLDPRRSHDVPEGHFGPDARGKLMVDRYAAYKAMQQVKDGHIVLVFCWAHVRRDFVTLGKCQEELKEWALTWLRRIRDLYRLNRQRLRAGDDAVALAPADAQLRQAIAAMKQQAHNELADATLRQPCRKVLTSLQEHWPGLTPFVDDPRIPMDNNAAERQMRGPALGRKNYYGSGSEWSGKLAMMMFSVFATLRLHAINLRAWLHWFLQSCAQTGGKAPETIATFLPWNLSPEDRKRLSAAPRRGADTDSS